MSNLGQKLASEKVKHNLRIEVHYFKAKLNEGSDVYIEVKRGKHDKSETGQTKYLQSLSEIRFDFQTNFEVTMSKKGKKYVKKSFSLKLFEIKSGEKIENGRVKVDFSQIPSLKKPIIKREISLQHCSDKLAVVCISVALDPIMGAGRMSPTSSLAFPTRRSLEGTDKLVNTEKKVEVPEKTLKSNDVEIEINDDEEKKNTGKGSDDESPLNMSFSDLIVHPRDSEVESESSSSEEEYKELPMERLVAHALPKTSKEYVTPNQSSKSLQITKGEEKAGISTKRESGTCTNCIIC